jgi:hypothetical protein
MLITSIQILKFQILKNYSQPHHILYTLKNAFIYIILLKFAPRSNVRIEKLRETTTVTNLNAKKTPREKRDKLWWPLWFTVINFVMIKNSHVFSSCQNVCVTITASKFCQKTPNKIKILGLLSTLNFWDTRN